MPWQTGFVPPDGYRYYIHGTNYRIKFHPCGHEFQTFDYENLNIAHPHGSQRHYVKDMVERRMKGDVSVQCPNDECRESSYWVDVKTSEMPESKYRAFSHMGWAGSD